MRSEESGTGGPRPDDAWGLARTIMERCDTLAVISEELDRLTRRYGTPAMSRVNDLVAGWMSAAGMEVRLDAIGNLIGRYEAADTNYELPITNYEKITQAPTQTPTPDLRPSVRSTLVLGSHLDTVRDAGRYDGPLGVMLALACVERLHREGRRLPFAIEVVGFADEEGLRYHTSYLGSRVYVGSFDPDYLLLTDEDGITLEQAIRDFGGDPDRLDPSAPPRNDLLGYVEVHIEQGPVLEARGLPVGIVSAISGQSRFSLTFTGEAGHAGTVPMQMRRDALAAASDLVLRVEALARKTDGLVATVGQLSVHPGASNVIPGRVALSLDVRHIDDAVCEKACRVLGERAAAICTRRAVSLDWRAVQTNPSVPCSPELSRKLEQAVEASGPGALRLPSGAGHDGVILSQIAPIAMLFVRCKGGISHNPAESVNVEDVAVAVGVMGRFLESLP